MHEAFVFSPTSIGKYAIADTKGKKEILKKRATDHDNSKSVQEMITHKKRVSLGLRS